MSRFKASEVEHYGGQGGAGFFQLKNDKDVVQVRFLYNGIEDVEGDSVHQIEIGDRKRYVNCLRDYKDPVDVCPFCREKKYTIAKLFIPLYNIGEDKVQIWERGKSFFSKMSSICSRYDNLVSHVFEIERNGKPGDANTRYEVFEVDQDNTTLEDLPEAPEVLGNLILDKTAEDMEYYLQEGQFPPVEGEESEEPIRRRGSQREETRSSSRRTPATNNRSDRF